MFPAASPVLATQGVALSPRTAAQPASSPAMPGKCLFFLRCRQRSTKRGLPPWPHCRRSASDGTFLPGDKPHICLGSWSGFAFPAKMQTGFGKISAAHATCPVTSFSKKNHRAVFCHLEFRASQVRPAQQSSAGPPRMRRNLCTQITLLCFRTM